MGAAIVFASGLAIGAALCLAARFRPAARDTSAPTASAELLHRADDLQAQVDARTADLQDLNARLLSIINSAVDGIVVIDGRGHVESFNPGAERLFGYAQAEVVGRNVSLLMPSPYHDEHDGYLARYHATGKPKIIGIGREVRGQRKDGSTFPLHLSVGEMTIGGERKFTGILHDLSERVRMEERLRAQASLATLGEMAAVIAHEVKNPLAGVRGAIQVIGGRLPAGSTDGTVIRDILARIDALNELMEDLLLFARPPRPQSAAVDILSLLARTVDLLRRDPALRHVQVDIGGAAPPISADAEMLRIVFHNLLVNAAHAHPRRRHHPRRRDLRRCGVPGDRQRQRARHSHRCAGQDLRAVLHHQVARLRPRAAHREASRRGARRHHCHRLDVRGHDRHRESPRIDRYPLSA